MNTPRVSTAEGIVIRRRQTGEADRIITLFTREKGKIRVLARGIRKVSSRRAPHLEMFSRVTVVVHSGSGFETVSEVTPIDSYPGIRSDLIRVSIAYYICELTDSLLADSQEHSDVYETVIRALTDLSAAQAGGIYRISRRVTLDMLQTLGFLPVSREPTGRELAAFVETVTEKRLKSTQFARLLAGPRA